MEYDFKVASTDALLKLMDNETIDGQKVLAELKRLVSEGITSNQYSLLLEAWSNAIVDKEKK